MRWHSSVSFVELRSEYLPFIYIILKYLHLYVVQLTRTRSRFFNNRRSPGENNSLREEVSGLHIDSNDSRALSPALPQVPATVPEKQLWTRCWISWTRLGPSLYSDRSVLESLLWPSLSYTIREFSKFFTDSTTLKYRYESYVTLGGCTVG